MSSYPSPISSYPHHPPIHPPSNRNNDSHRDLHLQQQQQVQHNLGHIQNYNYDGQHQNLAPALQQMQGSPYSNVQMNGPLGALPQGDQSAQGPVNANGGIGIVNGTTTSGGSTPTPKNNRLRKACDSCSARKVKCDESGPPCKACAVLEIPCTFERVSKRRGPPNRHAEEFKRRRLMDSNISSSSPTAGFDSPPSPNNVAATLASFSSHPVINITAEAICDFDILKLLVDDFFTYIHPLCPFPHEPSFRQAFEKREDRQNASFLALLASMIGVLVASFPRQPRLHLKAQQRQNLYANFLDLVDRCHRVAVEARGPGYLDNMNLSVYDAATSYFLGLTAAYTFQWRSTRLYFGETLNILRALGVHKNNNGSYVPAGQMPTPFGPRASFEVPPQPEPVDYIAQQIGRRIFWIMLVGVRSLQQLGATWGELLIPPPTPSYQYPSMPEEIDDEYIYTDHINPQPYGIVSRLTGFNLGIKIYSTLTPLATMEIAYGIDEVFDFGRQKKLLEECLRAVKSVLDDVPPPLMLRPGSQPGEFQSIDEYQNPNRDVAEGRPLSGLAVSGFASPDSRRRVQFEVQKANIFASQLATRSFVVEKYWNLQEAHVALEKSGQQQNLGHSNVAIGGPGEFLSDTTSAQQSYGTETNLIEERDAIVKDLLMVLGSISQVNIEPNGSSFINKIRQIASTLVVSKSTQKGPVAMKADVHLKQFLDILMKLERTNPSGPGDLTDEEEDLRAWADLRKYQMEFVQSGGFMNE